ncbi:unnamed protein product [Penicillium salamii]|uniref:Uncharacterized protein n=1 Tax=Penicillium salamii TaxID=1612424 RepID=A0A9W4JTG0_9EURO|nr:unnamed protein product [Penicillium salamii]CAG8214618.1 unnamed protein product [Penicillium salamii]CAG8247492.1 unnamed protein product [Penicillium salamii]CAG8271170.1 unnamed protein product [Penicillium salamii]CAG8271501.1 unnamed protein product [Penicillium salamii]
MASYLVTGCSRGLGLALIARLTTFPKTEVGTIIATARRDDSPRLKEVVKASSGRVQLINLDVTNPESVNKAVGAVEHGLEGKGLDYLINNAGVMDWSPKGMEGMYVRFWITTHHEPQWDESTTLASMAMADTFRLLPSPAYKISKAALNMLTVQYANQYSDDGFIFLGVSPGWLRTDLGSARADFSVETGAEKVLDIIQRANPEQNGKFINIHIPGWEAGDGADQYDGNEIPW